MDRLDGCAIIKVATVHGLLWDLCRVCNSVSLGFVNERTSATPYTNTECDPRQLRPDWPTNTSVPFCMQIQQVDPTALPPTLFTRFSLIRSVLNFGNRFIVNRPTWEIAVAASECKPVSWSSAPLDWYVVAFFFWLSFYFCARARVCVCLWISLFN